MRLNLWLVCNTIINQLRALMRSVYLSLAIAAISLSAHANIGNMAESINNTFTQIAALVGGGAYLVGLIFIVFGLFKFKQHRDNPQQIPIGTPFTMMGIGVLLVFLPTLITQTGSTIFSSGTTSGGASGSGFDDIGGSSSG
jgi:intracellular multiplication protein IcmD